MGTSTSSFLMLTARAVKGWSSCLARVGDLVGDHDERRAARRSSGAPPGTGGSSAGGAGACAEPAQRIGELPPQQEPALAEPGFLIGQPRIDLRHDVDDEGPERALRCDFGEARPGHREDHQRARMRAASLRKRCRRDSPRSWPRPAPPVAVRPSAAGQCHRCPEMPGQPPVTARSHRRRMAGREPRTAALVRRHAATGLTGARKASQRTSSRQPSPATTTARFHSMAEVGSVNTGRLRARSDSTTSMAKNAPVRTRRLRTPSMVMAPSRKHALSQIRSGGHQRS